MKRTALPAIILALALVTTMTHPAKADYLVTVKLLDSMGSGLAGGLVEYWASSRWQLLGITDGNGEVSGNIPVKDTDVRMTYEFVTNRIWNIDISANPVLTFSTIDVLVTLKTCEGVGLESGVAEYQSGYWRPIGTTDGNGEIHKEMLPANLQFKMTYAYGAYRFYQDTTANPKVNFNTTKVTINFAGIVDYQSGYWRPFTLPSMEMMPGTYYFKFTDEKGGVSREWLDVMGCSLSYPGENDADGDGWPDSRDNCPVVNNPDQEDSDSDGEGDHCDICPNDADNDLDDDGVCGDIDNCPEQYNTDQSDNDGDHWGDVCDNDDDNDDVSDSDDNCPLDYNYDQKDSDRDGVGDVCDSDNDNDGVVDADDRCPNTGSEEIVNADGCSIADFCPCDGDWKNHGAYVKCVAHTSEDFVADGLITEVEKDVVVAEAGQSACGNKSK